jgi:hypothetical protein
MLAMSTSSSMNMANSSGRHPQVPAGVRELGRDDPISRPTHLKACGNPVLPMEKPNNGERPGLEVVTRALRRLLFATCVILVLAFAVVCYAEMFGFIQFD